MAALPAVLLAAPALPAPTAIELVQVTDFSGLAASPDGRLVAFRTERASIDSNSYRLAWHVADLATGRVREVGGGGDPIYLDPGLVEAGFAVWNPDSTGFFHRSLMDGAIGLWRTPSDGSGSRTVVFGDADVEAVEPMAGGEALLYTIGPSRDEVERAERHEYDEGILVDSHVDLAQNLFRGGSINGRMASQRLTGRWFSRGGLLWRSERRQRRLDLASLADAPAGRAPPKNPAREAAITARSERGDEARLTTQDDAPTLLVRRREGGTVACTASPCRDGRIVSIAWRPGRDELVITARDLAKNQSLHIWNVGEGTVRFLAGGEGLLDGGERYFNRPCAITLHKAVCVAAGAISPPRLEAVDLDSGARSVLFDPNSELRSHSVPRHERLAWKLPDGRTATGTLLVPEGVQGRFPLLLSYYRCDGYLRGGEGDEWPFVPLVEAGIAVACIDALPLGKQQDALASYEDALASIRMLVDLLDRRGIIDRSKIGMGGFSFGSEVTMWVAMNSGLLAAASIASPQIEPAYYWFNAVQGRDQPEMLRQVWGLGPPDETPARWRRISPALNTSRIRAPLLMQLPEQEARMVVELYAKLSRSGTPVELHAFPDEAHIKVQPRHRLAAYRRNIDWFRFWLQGHADPDPAKADQYRRWKSLGASPGAEHSAAP